MKTNNCERRRIQVQNILNAFEIKRLTIYNRNVCIQTALSKPHGNYKTKI